MNETVRFKCWPNAYAVVSDCLMYSGNVAVLFCMAICSVTVGCN